MGSLKIWQRVPDGSRLELVVTAAEGVAFVGGARLVEDDGVTVSETQWQHSQICPGPQSVPVRAGVSYIVRVRIAHLTEDPSTVSIAACIVKPSGKHFGEDYEHAVTGRVGDDPQRATIIAIGERTG